MARRPAGGGLALVPFSPYFAYHMDMEVSSASPSAGAVREVEAPVLWLRLCLMTPLVLATPLFFQVYNAY